MKKILIAFNGTHVSEGAFNFASRLNNLSPIVLTGVFLPQLDLASAWRFTDLQSGLVVMPIEDNEEDAGGNNIEWFKTQCANNKMACTIHDDSDLVTYPALKKESRFADLLIIGSEKFYEYLGTGISNPTLKDALHGSECPVVIVPEHFEFPNHIILAYDGSRSSVYAIKQFMYLFPELCHLKTTLVYGTEARNDFPGKESIKELASSHFKNISFLTLHGNADSFTAWLNNNKASFVVSGSFSRSEFSQFFKKSFVYDVIGKHKLPVFIAHE